MYTDGGIASMNSLNSEINNLTQVLAASAMQEDAQAFNASMQEDSQSWQLQLWRMQNMYNLPINQVARLLQAGLNPSLVMGKGAVNNAAPIPPANMASSGIGHVPSLQHVNAALAAKQAQLVDSQIGVNESVQEKNQAEAQSARSDSELTDTKNRIESVNAKIVEQVEPILAENKRLENRILALEEQLLGNKKVRDDMYTSQYSHQLDLQTEYMELNNRKLERDFDLLAAEIDLCVSRGELTRAQANEVGLRAQILAVDRYMAQWEYNMARLQRKSIYGNSDSPDTTTSAFQELVSAAKKEVSNRLSRCVLNEKILRNDFQFEDDYGVLDRFYRFELKRRGANLERAQMYYGAIGAVSGAASAVISRGGSSRVAGAASRARRETDRQFQYYGNTDIQPDRSWNDF